MVPSKLSSLFVGLATLTLSLSGTTQVAAMQAGAASQGNVPGAVPSFTHTLKPNVCSSLVTSAMDDGGSNTLRYALTQDCQNGGTITFDTTMMGGSTITLTGVLTVSRNFTIQGPGAGLLAVSGNFTDSVFWVYDAVTVTISGLTIRDGMANDKRGGGVFNEGTLILANDIITGSTSGRGGGIYNNRGTLTVTNSTISSNSVITNGGGIYSNFGEMTVLSSTISNNRNLNPIDGAGGGIFCHECALTLVNSEVLHNSAVLAGGGIYHEGTEDLTVISSTIGSNSGRIGGGIAVSGTVLSVTDSNFHDNVASVAGGAIFNLTGTPSVTHSMFISNSAGTFGGAIGDGALLPGGQYPGGALMIENSSFISNSSLGLGGAIAYSNTVQAANSTFTSNTAVTCGGAILNFGILKVMRSTLSDNSATLAGGAIADASCPATSGAPSGEIVIEKSTLFRNSATGVTAFGGAIAITGTGQVTNSTFTSNTATSYGGAVFNSGALTLTHGTLSGNSASLSGGGIYNKGALRYYNTIIAHSIGGDCGNDSTNGVIAGNSHNLVQDSSCLAFLSGDPKLGPLQNNGGGTWTMALLPGSPAIDAGDSAFGTPTDQRGIHRPQGGGFDIGAFERSALYLPFVIKM